MDAVRCAGESKASELRGESMQDVIFNGTANRKPPAAPAWSWCSTTPTRRAGGQWNQFPRSPSSACSRATARSYFINNQPVRRRDVQDVFLGTGLRPRALRHHRPGHDQPHHRVAP